LQAAQHDEEGKPPVFGAAGATRKVDVFVEADFEANNLEALTVVDPINQVYTLDRQWIPSLLLGGGYSSAIGNSAGFYISILYDVIQDPNSPYYRQPIIRAGVGVGL